MVSWWNGIRNRLRNGAERRVGSSPTETTMGDKMSQRWLTGVLWGSNRYLPT